MTRYPTLERLHHLVVPTLVIAGLRDPLVKTANAPRLGVLPHVEAVTVPGAHALNYSDPQLIAELIEAHLAGEPLATQAGEGLLSKGQRSRRQSGLRFGLASRFRVTLLARQHLLQRRRCVPGLGPPAAAGASWDPARAAGC
jgi:hypothetical protein